MIDVTTKKCTFENCKINARYNYLSEKKPIFCKNHKLPEMYNTIDKKCEFENCKTQANYNYENFKKGIYCFTHKLSDMIDVKNKKCEFENCKKQPTFNFENENIGLYCKVHKLLNMIDVKNKKCEFKNCKKQPTFNFKNENIGLYCKEHVLVNMVDIKSKRCKYENCDKRPQYNFFGEITGIFCFHHKLINMVDVKHKKCKTHLCGTRPQEKFEGFCLRCFIYNFPDKEVSRNYKTKEKSVSDYISQKFPNFTWINDKIIENGCSLKRPDLLLDLGYQIVIVEVDENKHDNYDCSCENKRLMEISQDLGHRPIIFIRFNPDSYIDINNKKINSCWGIDGLNINIVKNNKEWNNRLESLKNLIQYWVENETDKTIEIIQLYYYEK